MKYRLSATIACIPLCFLQLCLLLAAVSLPAVGQSIPYRPYSSGFASSTIYAIHQDKYGYMWFGTAVGVHRLDGVDVAHYGQQRGLANTFVTSIAEDSTGRMWFGTWGGGLHYLSHGVLRRYPDPGGILPPKVKYLMSDRRNRLWVGNNYGLVIIDGSAYRVLDLTSGRGGTPQLQITSIYERRNGDVLIGTMKGMLVLAGGSAAPVRFIPVFDKPVHAIVESGDGSLWIGGEGKIYRIDRERVVEERVSAGTGNRIWILKKDTRGRIWGAGTRTGAFLLERDSIRNISRLLTFHSVEITALCEDHEGNMWIGTYGMGACCIADFRCLHYTTKDGLSNNYILDMEKGPSGAIAVATRDGLNSIEGDSVRVSTLPVVFNNQPSRYTTLLTYDSSGALWVCQNNTIFRRSPTSWESVLRITTPRVLYCDRQGTLWITGPAANQGTEVLRFNGREFAPWRLVPQLNTRKINTIYQDRARRLWFATDSGAYAYSGSQSLHYHAGNGLLHNAVNDIVETDEGLWMATDSGLSCLATTGWRHYTRSSGLSSNACIHLLADSGGVLWIGTYRGLNKLAHNSITVYDTDDGLISNEIQSLCRGGPGILWIGTVRGITKFSIQDGTASQAQLPLYITGVRTGNRFRGGASAIVLPYRRRTFSIEYIGISYRQPQEVRYRYKIIGLDDDWQRTSSRTVQYSSLPSGSYTFVVQAQSGGVWSPPATLYLVIETPFWEQWWFRAGVVVVSALALVALVQWRARVQQRREVERIAAQYRILQLEQKALYALMNPHFVFNALNSIHRLLQTQDEERAGDYLTRFARLIRMTFESAQSTYIVLEEELRRLELYLSLEKMRFEERLCYRIVVDPQVDTADVYVPSMILQPYVENAILHGILPVEQGGTVQVEIRQMNSDYLLLVIEDNGIGMAASKANRNKSLQEHRSSAMLLTEERLKLLSRMAGLDIALTISDRPVDSEGRGGTRVEMSMPVNIADAAG